ncbi:MAG: T9SS type A sorting domain-containing protein [Cyclobacteriaceae bacterium]|nr:T9SS type A sorting domain-containing protein [Cyclobacteriaceae bacterium]
MRVYLAFLLLVGSTAFAQTGPGGVGATTGATTLRGWWRADAGVTVSGGAVSNWADQSGYANDLSQGTAGNRPTTTTSASLNNRSIIRYTGSSSQFFRSPSFNGPGVDNITFFLVANGTSYQSLIRFQDVAGTFVVYPWEGTGGRPFISSSDGGTGSGIGSGLTNSVNNIGAARYRRNTTNGMQTYLNGTVFAQRNSVNSALPSQSLYSGKYAGGSEYPTADVGEMIVYFSALNDAQMVIVQNYLAAKYNATLSANDVYTQDNGANGDYDFDVAGIGQTDASNIHNDSRGTGFVRILNPSDLENGEFFMWGSDNGAAQATNTADTPTGVSARFARVWRVSETGGDGDVGSIDVQIDVTGLVDFSSLSTCDAALSLRLLVDTDNDGTFADQTPIGGATTLGSNVYRFANVTALANNTRFTFALVNTSVNGPGGVGGTSGTTSLALWLDANKGVSTTGSNVTSWADQSGNSRTATPPASNARPTLNSNALNSMPVISFDGNNDMLELASNINTSTPTMFAVINKTATGTGYVTFLTLQNNLWLARGTATNQWGMYNNTDVLSGQTLNATYRVLSSIERNFNDIDLVTNGTSATLTSGTGFHGKAIGTVGSNNNGTTNTGLQFFQGNIAELIVYTANLNGAQRPIVENALAAKYGLTLGGGVDVYTMDNAGNGNFDFDVAGIARVNAANQHTDAKGQGIVRIYDATDLGDVEAFFWGHNNVALTSRSTDVPSGVQSRLAREWGVNETGDVGAITMQFDLSGLYGSITASDLRLLIDHDGDGVYNEVGTQSISGATAISCGNYVFSGVTALNTGMRFTIGTINFTQTPLPIELVKFEGEALSTAVRLTWETESELNNDYFTVERSATGIDFHAVGTVSGAGTSKEQHAYELMDEVVFSGILYYRLKQTDFDGKVSYSDVIRVKREPAEAVSIYPNPLSVSDDIQIRISEGYATSGHVGISLFDVVGKPVFHYTGQLNTTQVTISTGGVLTPGVYVLKIDLSEGKTISRKISVVK